MDTREASIDEIETWDSSHEYAQILFESDEELIDMNISKLTIETEDGEIIELGFEQAKELHSRLSEIFGSKNNYIPIPTLPIEPYPDPCHPRPFYYTTGASESFKPNS